MTDEPMMSKSEIALIDDILDTLKPKFCLEWGGGRSTEYFPKQHPSIKQWVAIEHNGHWVQRVAPTLPDNAMIIWSPDNEWYIDCVKHSRVFDFILVDGLMREQCLDMARKILSPDGVVLLHDAGRAEYRHFITRNNGEMIAEGEIPQKDGGYAHRGIAKFGASL